MALAVYGKHPAKGDFLEHGIPAALKPRLESWLDGVLAEARADLGSSWEQVWRDAPMLRFWLGEAIWGQPVAGVMAASQDRVGRRFPLVMFCAGDDAARVPPPTIGDDGGWYDATAAHLAAGLAQRDLALPSDLLAGADVPAVDPHQPEPGPDSFWAVRPGAAVAGLLADIALTDHRRAAAVRSYWWVAGQNAQPPPDDDPDNAPEAVPTLPPEAESAVVEPDPASEAEAVPDHGDAASANDTPLAEPDAWDLPEPALSDHDESPFASGGGLSLFAAPMPADPTVAAVQDTVQVVMAPPVPRVLCSQVWAGTGLPTGQVLAWFLRGVAENA